MIRLFTLTVMTPPIVELLDAHNFTRVRSSELFAWDPESDMHIGLLINFKDLTYAYDFYETPPPMIDYEGVLEWIKENPHRVASKKFGI